MDTIHPLNTSFDRFGEYIEGLADLSACSNAGSGWQASANAALDGEPGRELIRLVDLETRREHGAFFTGSTMAEALLQKEKINDRSVVYDPAVGVGDLLVAAARKMGRKKNVSETVKMWNRSLSGTDRIPVFKDGCHTRFSILSKVLHSASRKRNHSISVVTIGDGLSDAESMRQATHIVMNPPFTSVPSPDWCNFASGSVNASGLFVQRAIEWARPGTRVLAILPEVFRTGSRYQRWRDMVSSRAKQLSVELTGQFSEAADVDVFFLRFTICNSSKPRTHRWQRQVGQSRTIADDFNVCVGAVVPYRDPMVGPERRFVHPRNLSAWKTVQRIPEKRRYSGRVEAPPFVAIRRTSRPGDEFRATASIVTGKAPVAVENHLIVCAPKDGRLESCKELLLALKSDITNEFLDEAIRCRHLTVGAVKAIPFTKSSGGSR